MPKTTRYLLGAIFVLATIASAALARPEKVVVFVGMPGAGKSTAAAMLAKKVGTTSISTGDVIRNEITARGLRYNAKNDRAVAEAFARRPGSIGKRTARQVAAMSDRVAVVEGFRTTADLASFRRAFPDARVVAIEVGTARRHARMLARGRPGEDNRPYLRDRDRAEVRRGVRQVMDQATIRIRPRGDSFAALGRSIDRVRSTMNGGTW